MGLICTAPGARASDDGAALVPELKACTDHRPTDVTTTSHTTQDKKGAQQGDFFISELVASRSGPLPTKSPRSQPQRNDRLPPAQLLHLIGGCSFSSWGWAMLHAEPCCTHSLFCAWLAREIEELLVGKRGFRAPSARRAKGCNVCARCGRFKSAKPAVVKLLLQPGNNGSIQHPAL